MDQPMKHAPADGWLPQLYDALAQMFRGHGLEAAVQGDWLSFPPHRHFVQAQIVREIVQGEMIIFQLDVRLLIDGQRPLIESVAGWDKDANAAVTNALNLFAAGSFYVLLAAFFGKVVPDQVDQAEKVIGGRKRWATAGNIVPLGNMPQDGQGHPDMRWFSDFAARLKAQPLPPGTHWVRFYYAQVQNQQLECEVLLDNEPWPAMLAQAGQISWPRSPDYYMVRWFVVIQDPPNG
jgi:hypothetical protein